MNNEKQAYYTSIISDPGTLPFSFTYDGTVYSGFPSESFQQVCHTSTVKNERQEDQVILAAGDLQVTLNGAYYLAYGAYEWTVWFENTGCNDSGVISNILAADIVLNGEQPVLKGILGDHENQYKPYEYNLNEESVHFRSDKGRPTHIFFPYFNLEHGSGGTLIAIGWGGTWEASFTSEGQGKTRFQGTGTNDLATYLKPGESIRSPLMSFLPYTGRNEDHAANIWRRWFIECNMPKLNQKGDPVQPFSTTWLAGDTGLPNSDGSISERSTTWKPSIDTMLKNNVHMDYRWFDAGWYCDPAGNTVDTDWWGTVGTWELDKVKWPGNSFRESVDYAHEHGMKTLVWFEPERVTHLDDMVANWGYKREWGIECGRDIFNNIGDPQCFEWTLNRILTFMEKHDINMYREDNNANPRQCWDTLSAREGQNRAGIVENKAVTAHYKLWDGIIAFCAENGKDTFVDSCASGGGRNDLESLRRGIPLMRSDADRTTTALRLSMCTAFTKWVPFSGAPVVEQEHELGADGKRDKYICRASYAPILNLSAQWVQDPQTDYDLIHFCIDEWNSVKDYLLKDMYVLTDWNGPMNSNRWTSYCYYDTEDESGVLFAFRMEDTPEETCTVKLTMLDPVMQYELHDADSGLIGTFTGAELAAGYTVMHPQPRTASLIYFQAVQ